MISLCCAYAFLIKRWWRLWHGDKILWIERIIMAVEGGDNMSFLINKPFLIKMLQKNSAALLLSILYFHHHEMAVLPSQPEQCLLDWNIHGSYMGGRKKTPKKPSERASQWHSCRDELQHLSNCGMKVSSVSLVVRLWGRRKACDHFIFKDVTFRRRPCNGESDVVDRETSHKVWQVGGESEEACFVFQSSFSSRAQSARRSLFESSVHFLLRLKKHTRDYVGVVQVRHDLLSLSLLWEGWKVLLRYSSTAHKSRRAFWEATRTVKCLSWSSGSQGFRATSRWRQTAAEQSPPPPLHLPTHPSVQTIPLLSNGRWDVVRLHSRMTLSCCVGQTGNEEDCRWRQVAIQSEAAVSVSIKLLHLAWPARWRQEARLWMKGGGGGGLFVFNELSMKDRQKHKEPESREREHLCVSLPLFYVLD